MKTYPHVESYDYIDAKTSLTEINTISVHAVADKGALHMAQKTLSTSNGKRKNTLVKSKSNLNIPRSLIISDTNLKKTKSSTTFHENLPSKKMPKDDLCTHCGVRQKGPGFRFLCRYCYRKAGNETVYSISTSTMNRDLSYQKISW